MGYADNFTPASEGKQRLGPAWDERDDTFGGMIEIKLETESINRMHNPPPLINVRPLRRY